MVLIRWQRELGLGLTFICDLDARVERLRDVWEIRTETEFMNDMRKIHHCEIEIIEIKLESLSKGKEGAGDYFRQKTLREHFEYSSLIYQTHENDQYVPNSGSHDRE